MNEEMVSTCWNIRGNSETFYLLLSFQVKFQMDYATMERNVNYEFISEHPSMVRSDIIHLISAETNISVPEGTISSLQHGQHTNGHKGGIVAPFLLERYLIK